MLVFEEQKKIIKKKFRALKDEYLTQEYRKRVHIGELEDDY